MANGVYDTGRNAVMASTLDWVSDTIKARLVPGTYTPNYGTNTTMTPVGAGIGTDQTLVTKSVPNDATNHFSFFKAANPVWTAVATGSTVVAVVVYKFITDDAGSTPIVFLDVTDTPTNGGDITIQFASDANGGVYKIA